MNLFIVQHTGLGDHIICNAIVRHYCKSYDHVTICAKCHNYASVAFMFRDLENLIVIPIHHSSRQSEIADNFLGDVLKLGRTGNNWPGNEPHFDMAMYRQAGVPHNHRWSHFHIERDYYLERMLFDALEVCGRYAVIHDDKDRKIESIHNKNINKIFLDDSRCVNVCSIFDYCFLLENATEIHCIDSCFRLLVDSIHPTGGLFFHRYVRGTKRFPCPSSRLDWEIIDDPCLTI